MKQTSLILLSVLVLTLLGACKKSTTDDETASDAAYFAVETAMSEAGSNATASETSGSVGMTLQAQPEQLVDAQDSIHPFSACSYSSVRSACSASTDSITWNGCTVAGGAVTMTGGWSETFTGTGSSSCTIPVADGGVINRTSTGSTMAFSGGATLTTDTNGGTAWDGTSIPSTGVSISNTSGTRTISIHGVHRQLVSSLGRTWFDHFLTSSGLTVTGTRSGGNRVITGSVTVYHNLASYKAVNTFNSVTWGSSVCCYPTSGNISSTFTGSITGNTTLTFTTTCGAATFTDSSGTSNITLTQCN